MTSSRLLRAYHSYLPIKKAQLDDIKQLLQHVFLPEEVTFYTKLTCVPCSSEIEDSVEVE